MKYSIDSAVRAVHKKACEPVQAQKQSSVTKSTNIDVRHIFRKKKAWLVFGSFVAVFAIVISAGIFVARKGNIMIENENNAFVEKDSTEYVQNDIGPQESHVFHITIDTEEFKVDADIIEGKTDDDLHKGVVHQEGSAFPSQYGGNVVITGHRWYPGDGEFSKVFQNMDKLRQGDEIIIEYKNKKYTYNVDNWVIVETSDTKFLEHTSKPQLTIYTCHPKFTSENRLVYTANLDFVEDVK